MDFDEMERLARERANRVAPKPQHEAGIAGLTGMFVTSIVCIVFLGIAGLDSDSFQQSVTITSGLGFLAPFLYFRHQWMLYHRAYQREYDLLKRDNSEPVTAS
jgi:hypothetical protein